MRKKTYSECPHAQDLVLDAHTQEISLLATSTTRVTTRLVHSVRRLGPCARSGSLATIGSDVNAELHRAAGTHSKTTFAKPVNTPHARAAGEGETARACGVYHAGTICDLGNGVGDPSTEEGRLVLSHCER